MYSNDAILRPRYAETDAMGVVYHSNYIIYFEVGRNEFFKSLGYPYRKMEEEGILFPVLTVEAKYTKPAKYDDELKIRTSIEELKGARVALKYEIIREDDGVEVILVTGKTVHGFVNKELKPIKMKRINPTLWSKLEEAVL